MSKSVHCKKLTILKYFNAKWTSAIMPSEKIPMKFVYFSDYFSVYKLCILLYLLQFHKQGNVL